MAQSPRSLSKKDLRTLSRKVPAWSVSKSGLILTRKYAFASPIDALSYAAKVTVIACVKNIFPELRIHENNLIISIKKTKANPLTKSDFEYCRRIDEISLLSS